MSEGEPITIQDHKAENQPENGLGVSVAQNQNVVDKNISSESGFVDIEKKEDDGNPRLKKIEDEARRAVKLGVNLTRRELSEAGFTALSSAITPVNYPGSYGALREKLGTRQVRVPRNYWENPANIEAEAKAVLAAGKSLTFQALTDAKKSSLAVAIYKKYPGGHEALKSKLGVEVENIKPGGYWDDRENIVREARLALAKGIKLTYKGLALAGLSSLASAATSNYPGGLNGLKKDTGYEFKVTRPNGYWNDPSNIEQEARSFLKEGMDLNTANLRNTGHEDLVQAIYKKYPGGFSALMLNLGLDISEKPKISPDEADEFMRSLDVE